MAECHGSTTALPHEEDAAIDTTAAYVRSIREVYPELVVGTVRLHTAHGQFNDILIVDDRLVFRFPRYAPGIAQLRAELAVLRGIRNYVSVSVPEPLYFNLDTAEVGRAFLGYPVIPGEPLWSERVRRAADAERRRLARQLATFLKQLHTAPANAIGTDLPVSDGADAWRDLHERFEARLFAHMRRDARARVARSFEEFLDDACNFEYEPALRHGDFGGSNILFDPASWSLTGVIDWSSAGLGDPAVDVAGLISSNSYGEPFLRLCYEVYPEIESMLGRARFYASTFALQEALHGLEHGDQEAFESGIAEYR